MAVQECVSKGCGNYTHKRRCLMCMRGGVENPAGKDRISILSWLKALKKEVF